ncbi:cytochrome P450 [Bimuria novae-zelandiae CBS 107.79]|uniref:Cytochrome P450 n=1 Tax=Bimuria novae-zelandiae CBS 107.79 TaxID=1447943 RepID=A0A6A5VME0_9PLEO|nr:cytochrome P450 [Bimuria novae-zelandiae CBS 107.79]
MPYEFTAYLSGNKLFVLAGFDTTSVSLCGLFFYLSYCEKVLDKLQQEITNTFESVDQILPGPKLSSYKYLKAAIDEAMRMTPAGPAELPRQVLPGGTEIDGEHFPENTVVGTAAWCDGLNDEIYGDVAIYRPERWLVQDTNSAEDVARIKANFHSFSIGPFNCAGSKFALQELMLVVATTVHRFVFRLASEWARGAGLRHRLFGMETKTTRVVPHFQVQDAYITVKDGPVLQFRKRRA